MACSDDLVLRVWQKGRVVAPYAPSTWRMDVFGSWMKWEEYGNRISKYGWEIDHINPDGPDHISNLQPLQWENNVRKSDHRFKRFISG